MRAKIFISCGQEKGTVEEKIAGEIASLLEERGFDPYVAIEEQTLRGVKENIFSHISSSEYFLFIDFMREKLEGTDESRGSLFSHQELAIASYLDIQLIAFQQKGVRKLDGLMRFMQMNCKEFKKPEKLLSVVMKEIKRAEWRPDWKNAIRLAVGSAESAFTHPDKKYAKFFHLKIENLNPHKSAVGCCGYLESVRNVNSGVKVLPRTVELKWAGYTLPHANVIPGSFRELDAFHVFKDRPNELHFNLFTDSSLFLPKVDGPGKFDLGYLVMSENFPPQRAVFRVTVGGSLDRLSIAPLRE